MNNNFYDNINFFTDKISFQKFLNVKPIKVFDKIIIDFFNFISVEISKNNESKKYPDLRYLGFFLRKSNLISIKKKYANGTNNRSGRGISMHFAPTNVPLNFAYSLLFGLISGNITLVRIGSNKFEQSILFIKILNSILNKNKFKILKNRISIFNYNKNKNITDFLSKVSDVRVIWGGDISINEIRKSSISSHAFDIIFPDRVSILIVNSSDYLRKKMFLNEAENFYNDSYMFDQNACTSPRMIFWIGSKKKNFLAQKYFWEYLNKIFFLKKHKFSKSGFSKLETEMCALINTNAKLIFDKDYPLVTKLIVNNPDIQIDKYVSHGGFFIQNFSHNLSKIKDLSSEKIQTITTIGFDNKKIIERLSLLNKKSVFRVVKNGRASQIFDLSWDGYDLLFQMSKKISVY